MRAAIYARYSTDLQSASSIEDQIRLCRERGWAMTVLDPCQNRRRRSGLPAILAAEG
jgi:DNA invertase Pin-like site-specific DNA recombinase